MKTLRIFALASLLALAACGADKTPPPMAHDITPDSIGYFCSMGLMEHTGPKGQIFVRERLDTPLWFSTVRQALAYHILPDMPKGIAVIYVTDTDQQRQGITTGPAVWLDARQAHYVIESGLQGGMGGEDAFPFRDPAAAQRFADQYGGRVLGFADIPEDYILNYESSMAARPPASAANDAPPPHATPGATAEDTTAHLPPDRHTTP